MEIPSLPPLPLPVAISVPHFLVAFNPFKGGCAKGLLAKEALSCPLLWLIKFSACPLGGITEIVRGSRWKALESPMFGRMANKWPAGDVLATHLAITRGTR